MKIAVDIDNTLFTCHSVVYRVLNKSQKVGKPSAKNLTYKTVGPDSKTNSSFLKFVFPMFNPKKYQAFDDAMATLDKWQRLGHEVTLLTNRPSKMSFMKKATVELLDYFDVPFDTLVMGCKNKHLFCEEFGISLLIDDNKQNCKNVNYKGIAAINFNPKNENSQDGLLFKANSWKIIDLFVDVLEYNLTRHAPLTNTKLQQRKQSFIDKFEKAKKNYYDEIIFSKHYLAKHFMIPESPNQAIEKSAYKNSKEEIKKTQEEIKNREKQNNNNDNELNK